MNNRSLLVRTTSMSSLINTRIYANQGCNPRTRPKTMEN